MFSYLFFSSLPFWNRWCCNDNTALHIQGLVAQPFWIRTLVVVFGHPWWRVGNLQFPPSFLRTVLCALRARTRTRCWPSQASQHMRPAGAPEVKSGVITDLYFRRDRACLRRRRALSLSFICDSKCTTQRAGARCKARLIRTFIR